MEAKSKPTFIQFNRSYDGRYGKIFEFNITMEDGTSGYFTTTKQDQDKFTIGKEVDYSAKETTDKKGNTRNKIDKVSQKGATNSSNSGRRSDSPEVRRSIIASVCLECANIAIINLENANNIAPDLKALHAIADKFFDHIMTHSNGDNQLEIIYQSRLKEVVNYLMQYKQLNIRTSTEILEWTDKEVAYIQNKMTSKS